MTPIISLRIEYPSAGFICRKKIQLLELISKCGSISAAARHLGTTYKWAWETVSELNVLVGRPLVRANTGGRNGGGTQLTPSGQALVKWYRAIETSTNTIASSQLAALTDEISRD